MNWVFAVLTFGLPIIWAVCAGGVVYLHELHGCTFQQGLSDPCRVAGRDISGLADAMGVAAAWGLMFLLPVSLASGVLWAFMAVLRAILRKTRNRG